MEKTIEGIAVLPMRDTVLFPEIITPVLVGREKSKKAIDDALASDGDKLILLTALHDASVEDPEAGDLHGVGTVARIVQKFTMPDDNIRVVVEGVARVRVTAWPQTHPFLRADIEVLEDTGTERTPEVEALVRSLLGTLQKLAPYIPDQMLAAALNIAAPSNLADFLAGTVNMDLAQRQSVLETLDVPERLRVVARILSRELDLLQTGAKINEQMASEVDKTQREFFLRRQLEAIRKELGDTDDDASAIDEVRRLIEEANPPEHVRKALAKRPWLFQSPPVQPPQTPPDNGPAAGESRERR